MILFRAASIGLIMFSAGLVWGEESSDEFVLGVQTHFQQNWPTSLIGRAQELSTPAVRDEIGWRDVEKKKGVYNFSSVDRYMTRLLESGLKPLIVITDTNPLYDEGKTPYTKAGMMGLASYISAIVTRYGVRNVTIELGNEVNSEDFVGGPFTQNKPAYLAATARAVRDQLRTDHPDAKFVCAGLNTVALGFFRDFFRQGGLHTCDAISVHPYRDNPDTLVVELARLKALMAEYGGEKPIYVTEFGKWFETANEAPDYMFKMVAQMAAEGVSEAYWYALVDEPWWPNMGLLERDGVTVKPAADAFRFLQTRLLPFGRPVLRSDISTVRLFEFGTGGNAFVAWGSGGTLQVIGEVEFFDTRGRKISPVPQLSDVPVVVVGSGITVSVEQQNLIADTKYQYNQMPWSYFALRPDIGLTPLEVIEWNWTGYRGAPDLSPLQIGDNWITTARFQGKPYHAVERFTAPISGAYRIEGWWRASEKTEASRLIINHNSKAVFEIEEITPKQHSVSDLSLELEAGDSIDFELAPIGPDGDGAVQRRIQVFGPLTVNQ